MHAWDTISMLTTDLADAGGRAGDEDDLAPEVLALGEGADEEAFQEAADEGDGEVDEEHQRQAHVHEAAEQRVHHALLAHLLPSISLPYWLSACCCSIYIYIYI